MAPNGDRRHARPTTPKPNPGYKTYDAALLASRDKATKMPLGKPSATYIYAKKGVVVAVVCRWDPEGAEKTFCQVSLCDDGQWRQQGCNPCGRSTSKPNFLWRPIPLSSLRERSASMPPGQSASMQGSDFPEASAWLASGGTIEVHGWALRGA
jgi:hypothetical protein